MYKYPKTTMSPRKVPDLPLKIITEILLKLSPKPLSKFKCVSKSWLKLISSHQFVKTHVKLCDKDCNQHRVMLRAKDNTFKVCFLPSLFHQESSEVIDVDSPMDNTTTILFLAQGSANGLIYMLNMRGEAFLWNPTTKKSKKLPEFGYDQSQKNHRRCGFGYDEFHDDYKLVWVEYIRNENATTSYDSVVQIYSLKTDTWRTDNKYKGGGFLISISGQFVGGKLYWASSANADNKNVENIVSFDITDETWGMLELPSSVKSHRPLMLGVMGSDLSVLSICAKRSSDVWIMKECSGWKKMFTIKYPRNVFKHLLILPPLWYSIVYFCESNEDEILLFLPGRIMIFNPKDGSIRKVKVAGFKNIFMAEIYVESLVDPLDY